MTLLQRICKVRREAYHEAKECQPWVFSRGAWVATIDANGDQCDPWPGADPKEWDGKISSLQALIEEAKAYPHVIKIVVEGGYDGAENMEVKRAGNYDPWLSSWTVEIWRRHV